MQSGQSGHPVDIYEDSFSEDSFDFEEERDREDSQEGGRLKGQPALPATPTATPPSPSKSSKDPIVVIRDQTPVVTTPVATPEPSIRDDDSVVSSESGSDSDDDTKSVSSQGSTVDVLSRDPLFMVLGQYLSCSTDSKLNIVDVLYKIHEDLKDIKKILKHK